MDPHALLSDLAVLLPVGVRLQRLAAKVKTAFGCDAVAVLSLEPGDRKSVV